jgi:hypothetical protein
MTKQDYKYFTDRIEWYSMNASCKRPTLFGDVPDEISFDSNDKMLEHWKQGLYEAIQKGLNPKKKK